MDTNDDTISNNIEVAPVVVVSQTGPTLAINVSLRIFPDRVEVDVLRSGESSGPATGSTGSTGGGSPAPGRGDDSASFAEWMAGVLRREGLTMEKAASQLGVSVKTVSRWVGGTTEPRLRDLRRIKELFGDIPLA